VNKDASHFSMNWIKSFLEIRCKYTGEKFLQQTIKNYCTLEVMLILKAICKTDIDDGN